MAKIYLEHTDNPNEKEIGAAQSAKCLSFIFCLLLLVCKSKSIFIYCFQSFFFLLHLEIPIEILNCILIFNFTIDELFRAIFGKKTMF